ncbi:MAG: CDP-glycerol glycerophosphotransferase family protein, partial [Candidatus Woesearchaeota archaeon]
KLRKIYIKNKNKEVLIPSSLRFYRKKDKNNIMFGAIIENLKKEKIGYNLLYYDQPGSFDEFKKILKFLNCKNKYIGDYYSLDIFLKNRKAFKKIRNIWNNIKIDKDFRKSLDYKGIDIYDLSLQRFDFVFNSFLYLVVDNLNITKKILEKEKLSIILLDHDNTFYGKGLMMNLKDSNKIKTIALQYEPVSPSCNHTHIKDPEALDKKSVSWRPLPTIKCIWAPYHKKILLEYCNYVPSLIKITGNPKFDNLINKKFNSAETFRKYNLDKNKKIVLFPTELDLNILKIILKSFRNLDDAFLIIKPHPFEDMSVLRDTYNQLKSKNTMLLGKSANMYELVNISSLIITRGSTVGLEAMIKGIPVVLINPYKYKFSRIPLFDTNAVIVTKNKKELSENIRKILYDKKTKDIIKNNIKKFVFEQAYKQDGKATERIINIIKMLLKDDNIKRSNK